MLKVAQIWYICSKLRLEMKSKLSMLELLHKYTVTNKKTCSYSRLFNPSEIIFTQNFTMYFKKRTLIQKLGSQFQTYAYCHSRQSCLMICHSIHKIRSRAMHSKCQQNSVMKRQFLSLLPNSKAHCRGKQFVNQCRKAQGICLQ